MQQAKGYQTPNIMILTFESADVITASETVVGFEYDKGVGDFF